VSKNRPAEEEMAVQNTAVANTDPARTGDGRTGDGRTRWEGTGLRAVPSRNAPAQLKERLPRHGTDSSNLPAGDDFLVKRFVHEGDKDAFISLIDRHLHGMRRLLFSVLGGVREDLEDTEQEIIASLFVNLHTFRFQSSFRTFLFRFCRNRAIDLVRKREREKRLLRRLSIVPARVVPIPEDELLQKEKRSRILDVLGELKEEERTLIILKDIECLAMHEIGRIFKLPLGTVKSRLHRARMKAASKLQKER